MARVRLLLHASHHLLLLSPLWLVAGEAKAAPTFTCPTVNDPAAKEKKARALFEEAVQLEPSDPEASLVRYQCASKLADRPAIALRIGIVAERLHKDDVAIVAFEHYLELAGTSAPDYEKMKAHVKELRDKPKEQPPPSNGSGNGQGTPGPAPTHEQPPSSAPSSSPPPPPPPPPSSSSTTYLGWGLVAGGGALAIAGSVFLALAKSKSDDVQGLPSGTQWDTDEARGAYESATRSQTIGIVLLAIAPVAIIAGTTMLFTSGAFSSGGKTTTGAGAARSSSLVQSPFLLRF